MRVLQELLSPRVEHAQKPDGCAEAFGVARHLEQRRGARAEEQVVHHLLVVQSEPRQRVRERKHDMAIADGQEFVLPGHEPLLARTRQTLRAMPVSARVEGDGAMPASDTAIEMTAQRGRTAARDGAEHAQVLRGQPGPVFLDEARRVLSNDVGHLEGWPRHCGGASLRERFAVSGLDTVRVSNGLGTAVKCRCDRWR